jgi:hypothetical protein
MAFTHSKYIEVDFEKKTLFEREFEADIPYARTLEEMAEARRQFLAKVKTEFVDVELTDDKE